MLTNCPFCKFGETPCQVAKLHSQTRVLELLLSWQAGNPVLPPQDDDDQDSSSEDTDDDGSSDSNSSDEDSS